MKIIKIVLVSFILFKSISALNLSVVNCFPHYHDDSGEELILRFYSENPRDDIPFEKCIAFREKFVYPNIIPKTTFYVSILSKLPRKWTNISLDKVLNNPQKNGLSILMLKKGAFGGIVAETSYFSNGMQYIKK